LCAALAFVLGLLNQHGATAQKFQLGAEFTGLHLHKIDEAPFGVGIRFQYKPQPFWAADLELSHYPSFGTHNFGETAALAGVGAGASFDAFGVFIKARPGVMHFGGDYFRAVLDHRTHFIVDIGGMVEYYPTRRVFLRIDTGDTVIYYGNSHLLDRANRDALGTVHNFQPGFGVGVRW